MRLKLAAQGLPKGGNVGFELMENQKLGVSQFLEQVNYQRALEGETGPLDPVARPRCRPRASTWRCRRPSVFVREQQKPTASVLLNLHPGRTLDQPQVSAIVHLVATSVPELPAKNVTVVDQNGNLLSEQRQAGRRQARSTRPSSSTCRSCSRASSSRIESHHHADRRRRQRARRSHRRRRFLAGRAGRRDLQAESARRMPQSIRSQQSSEADRPGRRRRGRRAGRAVQPAAGHGDRADQWPAGRRWHSPGRSAGAGRRGERAQGQHHQLRSRQDHTLRAAAHGRHQAPVGRRGA